MSSSTTSQIVFVASEQAQLLDEPMDDRPLGPGEVAGETLVSLVSPGTELNFNYLGKTFPTRPGYAGVMRVTDVAAGVTQVAAGDVVFGMLPHKSHQRVSEKGLLVVPDGLDPVAAVFARLVGVSMTTLTTTRARPAERVVVMGLGPVGNLAAQIFQIAGYRVTGIDPIQSRCDAAIACGVPDARTSLDPKDKSLAGQVALVVECSGHEQAVLSGCGVVKKGGEVVLVGVPWKKLTDLTAHELLHLVFHKYVVLRSGWEWQVPRESTPFMQGSIDDNFRAALLWLSQGRIKTEPLAEVARPEDCQRVYQDLLHRRASRPVTVFDWR